MRRASSLGVAVILLLCAGCGRVGGEPFQPSLNTPIAVGDDTSVGQILNPPGDSVSRIDLSVATFAQDPDPEGILTVTIDAVGGPASARIPGSAISDGAWVAATFDEPVAVDDLTAVEVTWDGATPLALWGNRTLGGTADIVNDPYAAGQLIIDGQPTTGDLAFRVTSTDGSVAGQIVEVVRGAGARLRDQPVFTLVWLALLVSAAAVTVSARRGGP